MRAAVARAGACGDAADRAGACHRTICAGLASGRAAAGKHDGNGACVAVDPLCQPATGGLAAATSELAQLGMDQTKPVVRARAVANAASTDQYACELKQISFKR